HVALAVSSPSIAKAEGTDGQRLAEFHKMQFIGWSGISFTCQPMKGIDWQLSSCQLVAQEFALIAAQSNIPISSCVDCDNVNRLLAKRNANLTHPLNLAVEFVTTSDGNSGVVNVDAESFYANAVEAFASAPSPDASPRSGTLKLWNKWIAFQAGNNPSSSITPHIVGNIKEFVAVYITANR
uniref:hypothetical protein n=1 Tax=Aestuariivirga sp. TaxID=2650926 RepID=UPI003594309D